ncbi:MAG: Holliday junction resolvase RuvX [Gemmatimonadetes bacterium]|nr:Holliday junction resolvase RuvX [Gemmatimonadota bacterium]
MTRVLGIDYGERRIGMAISDPTRTIAQPLPTLRRRVGRRPPYQAILEIARRYEVDAIVVGLPLDLAGHETAWTAAARGVGDELARRLGVPVHYVDERLTSVRAERAVRSLGLPRRERERKERVDAAAAVLILQAWLDGSARS